MLHCFTSRLFVLLMADGVTWPGLYSPKAWPYIWPYGWPTQRLSLLQGFWKQHHTESLRERLKQMAYSRLTATVWKPETGNRLTRTAITRAETPANSNKQAWCLLEKLSLIRFVYFCFAKIMWGQRVISTVSTLTGSPRTTAQPIKEIMKHGFICCCRQEAALLNIWWIFNTKLSFCGPLLGCSILIPEYSKSLPTLWHQVWLRLMNPKPCWAAAPLSGGVEGGVGGVLSSVKCGALRGLSVYYCS